MSPEADVAQAQQIVLDDLRKAESSLLQKTPPDAERTMHLAAIRSAISQLLRVTGDGPR